MLSVVRHLQDAPCILRGGSALAFTRGLNRHTTDLDFDLREKTDMKPLIRAGVESAGMKWIRTDPSRHRRSSRYWVEYSDPRGGKTVELKVDTHAAKKEFVAQVQVVSGILTYSVEALFEQKLAATRSRREPRDLFDLSFIATRLGGSLNDSQILRLRNFISNPSQLGRRYKQSFDSDEVLRAITTYRRCTNQVARAVASEVARRGIIHPEQRIRVSDPIFQKILAYHQRRLDKGSDDQQVVPDRLRTDDRDYSFSR